MLSELKEMTDCIGVDGNDGADASGEVHAFSAGLLAEEWWLAVALSS